MNVLKKIFKTILILLGLISISWAVWFLANKYSKGNSDKIMRVISDNINKAEFIWNNDIKIKDKNYYAEPDKNTQTVWLYVGDNKTYPVIIPGNSQFLSDYSTYIYDKERKFEIIILDSSNMEDIKNAMSKETPEILDNNVVSLDELDKKSPQISYTYLYDTKAILVMTFGDPISFYTVRKGFLNNRVRQIGSTLLVSDNTSKVYSSYSYIPDLNVNFHSMIERRENDPGTRLYSYTDGFASVSVEIRDYEKAKEILSQRMKVATGMVSNKYDLVNDNSNSIYYEMGNFTAACWYDTFNTSISLFGMGDEARFNIRNYYKSVQRK